MWQSTTAPSFGWVREAFAPTFHHVAAMKQDWSWKPEKNPPSEPVLTKKEKRLQRKQRRAQRRQGNKPQSRNKSRDPFYVSEEWLKLRYEALVKWGARCQCCGATAADGAKIHVDHIKPRSRFRHLQLELSNLQVLCARCNYGKRAWDQTDWRPEEVFTEAESEYLTHLRDIQAT